ncbi:MAG TPA: ethylbenzene dehydrogenase-related protein [Thermodesulfobacteriota bacterium]|nr:ethylbenzene dehydrogenase-related protein [Thermodesulfobacteriota bacterium]
MKKKLLILAALSIILVPIPAIAAQGNKENGKAIYDKKCWWCHGENGAGDGPAAEFLNPPPRDFTAGWFKFKSTPFDELFPADEDIFRVISGGTNHASSWGGLSGTAMPNWDDKLKEQERWDLVAYITDSLGHLEKPQKPSIDYKNQIKTSKESIEKGKEIFQKLCVECHGEEGKGSGTKKLKDDLGFREWPRNLTKPWTFRINNDPKEIYTRISVGIPGTQMPSFADPASKKTLSDEERWHVANYVNSIGDDTKKPNDADTVLKAIRFEGELPDKPDDPRWKEPRPTSFYLIPQIIAKERFFTPTIDSITARAFFNDKEISILLEWDDRTKSIPGDEKAKELAEGSDVFEDSVALQFSVTIPEEMEKPYFGMGDSAKPVNIWQWKGGKKDSPESVKLINANGFQKIEQRDAAKAGLKASSAYSNGTWRVVMKRPLTTEEKDKDIQFVEGKFIPLAFAAWDGSNGETGSKHVLSTWYWIQMKPVTSNTVYIIPVIVGLLVFGGELLLIRKPRK